MKGQTHREIVSHFVRVKVNDEIIGLVPIKSEHQLADLFTHVVSPIVFKSLMSKMSVTNIYLLY